MGDILWTSADAEDATGGRASRPFAATGVSIDTRTLRPGDLFVALTDARDGHDFVGDALRKGAAAALVSRIPEGLPADPALLVVDDVLRGLEGLGRAGRARARARVVAVTGSVGKTSTKEMLRSVLTGAGTVHAAEASYNNHWGVPLTLARMPKDTDFAVIEIGMNHPGEIAPLARMARPHVALITTVAPAHLFAFGGIDGIAQEKATILDGLEPGGTAVLPTGLSTSAILMARAVEKGCATRTFGPAPADWELSFAQPNPDATIASATRAGVNRLFKIAAPGAHFVTNGLGVLAVAEALGLDLALAAHDLGRWQPPPGRGARQTVLLDPLDGTQFDLIDDAFNANPASMDAALSVLALQQPQDGQGRLARGRRIAILGDMLELGDAELDLHEAIARHPALPAIAKIHCVGPRMRALHAVLPEAQRGRWAETAAELLPDAASLVDAGDVVLVKGSKGIKVSLLVDALRKLGQPAPTNVNDGTA